MKQFQRIISFVLAFVLVLGMVPMTAAAEETVPEATEISTFPAETEPAEEPTVPAESEPAEETTVPPEETEAPEETTVPPEETEAPEETTVPAEETEPPEETTAPAEETEPPEEPTVPADETHPPEDATVPEEETVAVETAEDAARDAAYDILASGTCGNNLTWELTEQGTLSISGEGEMIDFFEHVYTPWHPYSSYITEVVIEDGITSVGSFAFGKCENLRRAVIGGSVTTLGDYAFWECRLLNSVTLPDGLKAIPDKCFYNCDSLVTVIIPDTVTEIGFEVFAYCDALKRVELPDGLKTIGDSVFYRCHTLEEINIPDAVKSIESYAFYCCYALKEINIPDSLKTIGDYVFFECIGLEKINISEGLEVIGNHAFGGCVNLTEVILPDIRFLGSFAFDFCSGLRTVVLSKNLVCIQSGAFYNCDALEELIIPSGVMTVSEYAFYGCTSLNRITFEGSAPWIYEDAFENVTAIAYYPMNYASWSDENRQNYGGNLTWVAYDNDSSEGTWVPENLLASGKAGENVSWMLTSDGTLTIRGEGKMADFKYRYDEYRYGEATEFGYYDRPWVKYASDITSVIIDEGVTSIGNYAFYECTELEEINIPDGLEIIGDYAFDNCDKLTEVILPNSIISLGEQAFYDCDSLKTVILPQGLMQIGSYTFNSCNALGEIIIPSSVMTISSGAFGNCKSLNRITFEGSAPWIFENAFEYVKATAYYPGNYASWSDDMRKSYGGTLTWESYDNGSSEQAPTPDTVLGSGKAGENVNWKLTGDGTLTISGEGKMKDFWEISDRPWDGYVPYITSVVIEDGVTSVGRSAFAWCINLKGAVNIPGTVRTIGGFAFYECSKLEEINLPDGLEMIEPCAFMECVNLTEAIIPDSVYYMDNSIFDSCSALETVVLPKGLPVIESETFYNCISLKEITIPASVTGIDGDAFDGCKSLNKITFTGKAPEFGSEDYSYVFMGVTADAYYPVNDASWTSEKLQNYGGKLTWIPYFSKDLCVEHQEKTLPAKAPACTESGLTEGKCCALCGKVLVSQEMIPALGHIKVSDATVAPTCTEKGLTEGSHCSVCNVVLVAQEEIPAHGHDFLLKDGDFVCTFCGLGMYLDLKQEHIILQMDQPYRIQAEVSPADLADDIRWTLEEGGEKVLSVDAEGNVTTLDIGTAYVVGSVSEGDITLTARCRVDVSGTIEPEGIRLSNQKLTSELYSTDYTVFDVLMQLPQNDPVSLTGASQDAAMAAANGGAAIENAYFSDKTMAKLFDLVVLDDRRVQVVPTDYAVTYPDVVSSKYVGPVIVTIRGKDYTSESLTLTVKKSTPKLKATVAAFNSFYSGDSQKIQVTGGTPTRITASSIPPWLTLKDGALTLTADAPLKNASGKATLLVETEEWRIPAAVTVSVKNTYKAPGLKLSATSVTLTTQTTNSSGVELKLLPKNAKDTLKSLNVTGITAPAGYSIANFSQEDGTFTLKAEEGFWSGKVDLHVNFSDTKVTLPLTLNVKTAAVTLKTSVKSLTLNTAVNDSAVIDLTATPADYRITEAAVRLRDTNGVDKTGELDISHKSGKIHVSTNRATPTGASYKLYISAGGSKEVAVTIKTVSGEPSVSFKAKSAFDLSFPEKAAEVAPTFKNYNGTFTVNGMTAETSKKEDATKQFHAAVDGKTILVTAKDDTSAGSYTLNLNLKLEGGKICKNTVKVTVKRTAVKLKLSATKLTLNKAILESGTVDVSCTTKGYDFTAPVVELSNAGQLNITYVDGKLTVATNAQTRYGATYKVQVKADTNAPAVTLTVTIPTQAKSAVTATLKASGSLDVIRDGSAVMVTPSYKNVKNLAGVQETLVFYSSADNYVREVKGLFRYEPNGKGGYTVTKADGAKLDHSLTYKVELVSSIGGSTVISGKTAIKVTMGSAKLTLSESSVDLFAKDKNDRAVFRMTAKDAALNIAERVEIKDAKYQDLFEIYTYGNGEFAIGFNNGQVDSSIAGKTVTLTLNVWMEGNQTAKVNTTVKLKVNVIK